MDKKVIHYCWFGKAPLSEQALISIESWRKHAPGFKIVEWNETNFDIESCAWSSGAYRAGKYAFVSDYARFKVLYEHGGVYMDVGSELVRDIVDIVDSFTPFSAIEESSITATPGLIISVEPNNILIGEVLEQYESLRFQAEEQFMRNHLVNEMFTSSLEKRGFKRLDELQRIDGWTIFPSEYFNPIYSFGGFRESVNTYSIHHSSGSWVEPKYKIKRDIVRKYSPFIGRRFAQIIGRTVMELKTDGLLKGLHNIFLVASGVLVRKKGGNGQ